MTISYTRPALIGGAALGVLSGLPIVSAVNTCCCLWVLSGGVLAAYLLQQDHDAPITLGDGALVGLLAGLFGALVMLVVSIPVTLLMEPFQRQFIAGILERFENIPPELRDRLMSGGFTALRIFGQFVISLVAGAIFATLGGVIGAAIFQKKMPPGTVEAPPTTA
ncbi:MAG TPA: hypothetical protein VIW45_09460 [Vicinamibacterales bacterium]|jgi:hypothetical protein